MQEVTLAPIPPNPCTPSPCGPNSQCQVVVGQAQCGCVAGMIGSVPNCRPECIISSDCPSSQACMNQKCVDPCPGTCASNAECKVVNHSPLCICTSGYTGDGFRNCLPIAAVGKKRYSIRSGYMLFFSRCFLPSFHFICRVERMFATKKSLVSKIF